MSSKEVLLIKEEISELLILPLLDYKDVKKDEILEINELKSLLPFFNT